MAPATPPALASPTTRRPQQPYTASFLARLSTFILHTPRPKLKSVFDVALPFDIPALSPDPNSPKPDATTIATCQRLLRTLNHPIAFASPDTVPYALCLLLRFRMVPPESRDISDETWVIIAVYLAYKWLTEGGQERLVKWAQTLETNTQCLAKAEKEFLKLLDYRIMVPDREYVVCKDRLDQLWRDVYSKAAKPAPPSFMLMPLGRLK